MRTKQKCVATDTWRSLGCRTTPLEHWSRRKPTVEPRWAKQQTKKLFKAPTFSSTSLAVINNRSLRPCSDLIYTYVLCLEKRDLIYLCDHYWTFCCTVSELVDKKALLRNGYNRKTFMLWLEDSLKEKYNTKYFKLNLYLIFRVCK